MNRQTDEIRKVSTRELQHNLADFLEIAKVKPLSITKHGREEVIMMNPEQYRITKINSRRKKNKNIMLSPFISMNRNKKEWKNKSSLEIADNLRKNAWYGI